MRLIEIRMRIIPGLKKGAGYGNTIILLLNLGLRN
jgi:hypothetical protein